jgi:AcrR family transcriptional regulator
MSRWEPDAPGRLQQAAYELYTERGYDQTTVAEIAARAGLTERTFFRHFADKREVLFSGTAALQATLVNAVISAPDSAAPLEAVAAGVHAAGAMLSDAREHAYHRQQIIAASAELRERELVKMAALSTALAEALRHRGLADPAASLAADAGIAVFRVAFDRWIGARRRTLASLIDEAFDELKLVTASG